MIEILVALVSALVPPHVVDGFRSTAPDYLTSDDQAREHVAAAIVAGMVTDTEPTLLLSIAYGESRYQPDARTPEAGGRVSCGVMTPEPLARCPQRMTVTSGYLAGARHVRVWLDHAKHETTALFGVAGGWRLIKACAHGGRRCYAPAMFKARAARIRRAIEMRSQS